MISNVDKTSIFDREMGCAWRHIKQYLDEFVDKMNMLQRTTYRESDFICKKLDKYQPYYVYLCDPHDKLIFYLSNGRYSFTNHLSCNCDCCHNVHYIIWGFY